MSSQDFDTNIIWEKEIQQKLNKIYVDKLGYDILSRAGERRHDLRVRDRNDFKEYTIEEKIIRHIYPLLCVELIQDIETGNWGLLCKASADYLHWIMCENGEPQVMYIVKFKEFKEWYFKNCGSLGRNFYIESEGWGKTFCHNIPMADIPNLRKIIL